MAGGFVNIDIRENSAEVGDALDRLAVRVRNLKPVFKDIGEYLMLSEDQRFSEQKSPEGDPWAPLNPKYAARKKRNKSKILILDDVLAGTMRYQATAESLLFGTDRIYGATHQFGDDDRGIPDRPFLGISPADETEILNIIRRHLEDAMG
jgi:phage virion morphogenesis protein